MKISTKDMNILREQLKKLKKPNNKEKTSIKKETIYPDKFLITRI